MANIVFILNGEIDKSGIFSGGDRHTVGLIKHCIKQGDKIRIIGPEGAMLNNAKDLREQEWILTEQGELAESYRIGRVPFTLLKYLCRTIKGSYVKTDPCDVLYSGSILPHEVLIGQVWKKRYLCRRYVCRCDQIFHLEPFRQKPQYFIQNIASRIGMRAALKSADLVITMNNLIASQWQSAKESPDIRPGIECLYYGLDDDLSPYKKITEKEFDIVFFSRLDYVKGADLIPGILKAITAEKPDIKLIVIGDGPLRKTIEDECKSLNIEKNIKIKGTINTCKRFEFLARSKILLYPTREDSFAKSVAEALTLGIPAVSSNNPHFQSVYGDTLLYAESEHPKSYSTQILNLLKDDCLREDYVAKSLKFAESLPSEGNYANFRKLILQNYLFRDQTS